jgi:hypothetical protein
MMGFVLEPLPDGYLQTREALHALACYVIAPARKARTGHIGLCPTGDGFGTPPFDDGTRIRVRADHLIRDPDLDVPITTLRAAAELLDVELKPDPGVGHDLPPFEPDVQLPVDATASLALGRWYAFGDGVLSELRTELLGGGGTAGEITLWPEHFDVAFDWGLDLGERVNFGASPGDVYEADPYLYVSPWNQDLITEEKIWNSSFGAVLPYSDLLASDHPAAAALRFFRTVLEELHL